MLATKSPQSPPLRNPLRNILNIRNIRNISVMQICPN